MLVRSLQCKCGAVIGVVIPETEEERDPANDRFSVGWLGADEDGQVYDTRLSDTYACRRCGFVMTTAEHNRQMIEKFEK